MLIGITGLKRSGKDTAANHLADKLGYVKIGFADALKDIIREHLSCVTITDEDRETPQTFTVFTSELRKVAAKLSFDTDEMINLFVHEFSGYEQGVVFESLDDVSYTYHMAYRQVMQTFGTNVCRRINENIWVDCVEKKLMDNPKTDYVVTDIRFDNEAEMVNSLWGAIVEIKRGNPVQVDYHASEQGIHKDYVDHTIWNTAVSVLQDRIEEVHYHIC
jgi:hypothetical protein